MLIVMQLFLFQEMKFQNGKIPNGELFVISDSLQDIFED